MTQARIAIDGVEDRLRLFGHLDSNIAALEKATSVKVHVVDEELVISGDAHDVALASDALESLVDAAQLGAEVTAADVELVVDSVRNLEKHARPGESQAHPVQESVLATTRRGRPVKPRSAGQRVFVEAIANHTLTFAVGPAGTGKTFLAVVMALAALRAGDVVRIILSRPAVEAGENLGFLPGDLQQKVDPYLRPLFDALGEIMEPSAIERAVERAQIEVAPLAYMRGRTLGDSFIVLDEGQNTSREQMKMFLTRIGANSRMVVCGDVTQIDLVRPQESGLVHAARIFRDVEGVAVVTLDDTDVVRHPLIRRIIQAYGRTEG